MMPHRPDTARYVFVYGTLRSGGRNDIARYRPAPVHVGNATIAATLYDMGAYPGAVLGGAARVKGEVYRITPAVERALDALEEVNEEGTGEYLRRELGVDVDGMRLQCLVYEIHPSRWGGRAVIASGDWFDRG
jgi:gamma-glutamylcyclotransferase (GGCT)/AIG2-like uncharacterized protein YtfP